MGRDAYGCWVDEDFFLRRVTRRRDVRDGVVCPTAFLDTHPTLSFTFAALELRTEAGIDE